MPEDTIITEEEIIDEAAIKETVAESKAAPAADTVSDGFESSAVRPEKEPIETESKSDTYTDKSEEDIKYFEKEKPARKFFHFRKDDADFSRDKWILSRIRDEDLMDYLKLEQKRTEQLQQARDIRGKRLMTAFQLTVSLAAVVAIIYLLKDTPTILVNILYICGIIAALWLWKNPHDKK